MCRYHKNQITHYLYRIKEEKARLLIKFEKLGTLCMTFHDYVMSRGMHRPINYYYRMADQMWGESEGCEDC